MRPTVLALVVLAALSACPPAFAQGQTMARVNGAPITQEELDRQFDEILRERKVNIARLQDPDKAKAFKHEALERLIGVELLWQEAKRTKLVADEDDVARAIDAARQQHASHEAYVNSLQRRGHDEASHRHHVHRMLSADRYAQHVVERDVRVNDRDVAEFYAANPRWFKQAERVRARHIVVAIPAGADRVTKAKARSRIAGLLARVRAGEDFEALARQHSDDATRSWGGELDAFGRGEQPKSIEDAAFALAPGAVSGVIETAAGLHIVKVEQRIEARVTSFEVARASINDHLRRVRGRESIDAEVQALRTRAQVQLLGP